jgi:hypothetical protein
MSLSPTADIVALVQASTVLPYMLFCLAAAPLPICSIGAC